MADDLGDKYQRGARGEHFRDCNNDGFQRDTESERRERRATWISRAGFVAFMAGLGVVGWLLFR